MDIKVFEEVMKNDIKNIFEQILSIHNYILPISSRSRSGAGGGTRTHTPVKATDFESASSTNSNTPAYLLLFNNNKFKY